MNIYQKNSFIGTYVEYNDENTAMKLLQNNQQYSLISVHQKGITINNGKEQSNLPWKKIRKILTRLTSFLSRLGS